MPHAIIRGKNGRRREVDFGDAPVRVEIYASDETIEIFVEADFETLPEERRRFALLNIPRHLFSEATAATARRAIGRRRATLPSGRVLGMLHSLSISPISTYCARAMSELNRIGGNVNQLTHLANTTGDMPALTELRAIRSVLEAAVCYALDL